MSYKVYYRNDKKNFITYDGVNIKEENSELLDPHFELNKSYEKTEDNLKNYHKNIKIWSEQITNSFNTNIKPSYLDSFTDSISAVRFINFMSHKYYKNHEDIDNIEALYIDKTYNGGLMYCKESKKAHYVYSNDKNNYYTEIMGNPKYDFYIPSKTNGTEAYLESLGRRNLQYGYFHVKIEPKNDDAYKIFSFNANNWYNYYDIKFILYDTCDDKLYGDCDLFNKPNRYFNFELIDDGQPNAYIYDSDCIVKSSDIFGNWFKKLSYLKSQFPDNKLIKNLSRAWGGLSMKNNIIKVNENDILENPDKYDDYEIIDTHYNEESTIHILQKINNKPYKHNIRLKSWLNSFARCELAKTILKNIDNVVRVQTDSITYNIDVKPDNTEKREEKSTGYIKFNSVNSYKHKCRRSCKNYYKYKDFKNHDCK
jgi:hypothetical protein